MLVNDTGNRLLFGGGETCAGPSGRTAAKGGASVKLRYLQETDKALINYEPEAYTPAVAIKVTGKGAIQKIGGDD